ncbi:MAG TPA: aminotransferase class V-fold PLP-dependent enzyme, partial [Thermoanaerobaculia bacterium]|nr:aminotransferase class V-fold PLP-dependent enzyme [Thermoanaerobaculia bacterium]
DEAPDRAETGTQNQEGIAGIGATIDFLASFSEGATRREKLANTFTALHERGTMFASRMWDGLSSLRGVRVYGPPPPARRTPTIAFTIDGKSAEEVTRALVRCGVFTSHGDFYAATVVEVLGVEALVRAGCACYTNDEEVERLIEAVAAI